MRTAAVTGITMPWAVRHTSCARTNCEARNWAPPFLRIPFTSTDCVWLSTLGEMNETGTVARTSLPALARMRMGRPISSRGACSTGTCT